MLQLALAWFVVVGEQPAHRDERVTGAVDDVEDHRSRVVDATAVLVTTVEGRDDLEALDGLLLALGRQRPDARLRVDGGAELDLFVVEVDAIVGNYSGVFEPLLEPAFFSAVRVNPELGTVIWPNGADLCPDVLYAHATGQLARLDRNAA